MPEYINPVIYAEPPLVSPSSLLTDQQQAAMMGLLSEFKDACTNNLPIKTHRDEPDIHLYVGAQPTFKSPYKLSQLEQLEVKIHMKMYFDKC